MAVREKSSLFPDLDGFASAQKNRNETTNTEKFELGLTSEYELDLWGRIRAAVDSETYEAEATLLDYQTAALTLSTKVVSTWYRLLEAHNQLILVKQQIDTNEKILDLLNTRFGSGQIRSSDILRQKQLLEATREQKYFTESTVEILNHQLAVLLGRSPQDTLNYTPHTLPALPALPSTGLPAELVRRRPDVQAAFYRLKSADRDTAAAISDRFPRLTFSISVSTEDNSAVNLFDNWARSFAGNLAAPLLDAGHRRAEVDRTQSVKDQRLFDYGQIILTAFQEVEDALILETKQSQQIDSLKKQIQIAKQTNERLQFEYFNGGTNYIDVLISLTDEQQLQKDLLSAKLDLLDYRIALYRALAGGFKTEREAEYGD